MEGSQACQEHKKYKKHNGIKQLKLKGLGFHDQKETGLEGHRSEAEEKMPVITAGAQNRCEPCWTFENRHIRIQ